MAPIGGRQCTPTMLRDFHTHGEPRDVLRLRLEHTDITSLGIAGIRVAVHACGLAPADGSPGTVLNLGLVYDRPAPRTLSQPSGCHAAVDLERGSGGATVSPLP